MSSGDTITRTLNLPPPGASSNAVATQSRAQAAANALLRRLQWAVGTSVAVLLLFALIRLSFINGLVRRATIDGPSLAPVLCGASFEVTCDDCAFRFRCDAEHVPPDRLAACPNCGYTQNDLDRARLVPPEQVVIDRWRLLFRQPRRGEIVACNVSGSPGELAVKRVATLPTEQLAIRQGDLYINGHIVRKSLAESHAVRLLVHDNDYQPRKTVDLPPRWRGSGDQSQWRSAATGFERQGAPANNDWDWFQYEQWSCTANPRQRGVTSAIRDNDSYNQGETRRPLNAVSDVMLTCQVRVIGNGQLALAAADGEQRFAIVIEPQNRVSVQSGGRTLLELPLELDFSRRSIDVEFGLCDQQVLLAVQGRTLVRLPYERPADAPTETLHPLAIGVRGLAADVRQLRVWRDVYYLDPQGLARPWQAPTDAGSNGFALLGDNAPVSIDSRQWEPPLVPASAIRGLVYRPFWAAGSSPR
jgi:signal peptidase I